MAFCGKCGTKIEEGVKFCPGCGKEINEQPQNNMNNNNQQQCQTQQNTPPAQGQAQQHQQAQSNDTAKQKDLTHTFDPADIEKNKAMGLLGYLIFFIPLLAAKDSSFAKFHANQGFVLFLGYIISSVLLIIPLLGWVLAPICYIILCVFSVMGIIDALGGKAKNLPIIGKIKIFK